MTKPRKKYKHNPGKKWDNPLCKQAEAAGLERWRIKHMAMLESYEQGQAVPQMLVTLADVIAPAIKSMEGWDDPDDIGGVMCDAMDAILNMSQDGYRWDKGALPLLKDAIGCAVQVTNGMPVIEIAKAVHWARQVNARVAAEVA